MTDSIYELLECSVCLDVFQDPRILPCGHTFCLECLQKRGQKESSANRVCSLCRSAWQEPGSRNLDELPKNFVVNSVLSTLQRSNFTHEEATISTSLSPRQTESKLKAHFAYSVVQKHFRNQHVDILSVKKNKVLFGSSQSGSCSLCVFELHKDTPKNIRTFSLASESRRIRLRDATWTCESKIVCAARSRRNDHAINCFLHNGMAFSQLCDLNPFLGKEASIKIHCRFELRSLGCHAFCSDAIFLHANWQGMLEPSKSELELEGSMIVMTLAQDTMWLCLRVIRTASSDDWFDYWTLELLKSVMTYRLCKHTANKQTRDPTLNAKIVWSDRATPVKHDVMHEIDCASLGIDLSARSVLAYDEAVGVFLADYKNDAVHLFSTDGQYLGQILSRTDGLKGPCSLGVNTADRQLIVGQRDGEVRVYDLGLGLARKILKLLPFVGTIKEYVDHVRNNRVVALCLIVSFISLVISFFF